MKFHMEFLALFLSLVSAVQPVLAGYETGAANQVLRVPGAGGRPKYGQVALNQSAAVTGTLPYNLGGTGQSSWTTGDLLYASGTNTLGKLTVGANGTVMKTVGGVPTWAAQQAITTQTSAYAVTIADDLILANVTGSTFAITLPTAVGITGKVFRIKKIDSTSTAATIATTSSQTIDSGTTKHLNTQWEQWVVVSDGANWQVLNHFTETAWVAYTPIGAWTTNTTYSGFWRRSGDTIRVRARIALSGAPDVATATIKIPNPTVWSVDTAKLGSGTTLGVGTYSGLHGGNGLGGQVIYVTGGGNSVSALYQTDFLGQYAGAVTKTTPFAWVNTDYFEFDFALPITNWEP